MSPLDHLVAANAALVAAEEALRAAKAKRIQSALELSKIPDYDERLQAALFAYKAFGAGLSQALAEAVTGRPGNRSQAEFLTLAGKRQPQQARPYAVFDYEPMLELPNIDDLEREVIAAHRGHKTPYEYSIRLGWTAIYEVIPPGKLGKFIQDPTKVVAEMNGISREEFCEWLSSEGWVPCDGTTKAGMPCKRSVAGLGSQLDLGAWLKAKRRGGYCSAHAG